MQEICVLCLCNKKKLRMIFFLLLKLFQLIARPVHRNIVLSLENNCMVRILASRCNTMSLFSVEIEMKFGNEL